MKEYKKFKVKSHIQCSLRCLETCSKAPISLYLPVESITEGFCLMVASRVGMGRDSARSAKLLRALAVMAAITLTHRITHTLKHDDTLCHTWKDTDKVTYTYM